MIQNVKYDVLAVDDSIWDINGIVLKIPHIYVRKVIVNRALPRNN